MRTLILLCAIVSMPLFAQEVKIIVTNPEMTSRPGETVTLSWVDLCSKISLNDSDNLKVIDNGLTLVSQKIDTNGDGHPDVFIFRSAFGPGEKKEFDIRRVLRPDTTASITDAKYILPRKDVAWENDRIAFRIYGGPLAGVVLNGLDVWVKRVRYHVIDKWYDGDSLKGEKRISYHVDHGEGADLFNVGRSLGAGGSAVWKNGGLLQPGMFTKYQIICTGPIRAMFKVWYRVEGVDSLSFTEACTYTLDASQNLNRVDVRYFDFRNGTVDTIAIGLVKREGTVPTRDDGLGLLSLWGPTDQDSSHGYTGTAIVIPASTMLEVKEVGEHFLALARASQEQSLTYFAGASWSRSGDFSSQDDWNAYLNGFAEGLAHPLLIKFFEEK